MLTKIGIGTLTLTGANTYSGGTNFDSGFIAVDANSALGAATGPLTFNGGGLQLLSSFNLSPGRVITLQSGGGTIDSNGFETTISQAIAGTGGLTVLDSGGLGGAVILNGVNTYTGPTNVNAGTLAIGAPNHSGASLSGAGLVTVSEGGTLGGYGTVAGAVVSSGRVAVADAVGAFAGGPTGTFTINSNFQNDGLAQIGGSSIGNVLAVKGDYNGGFDATAALRTELNEGGALSNQFTDRLLISGAASGTTIVNVEAFRLRRLHKHRPAQWRRRHFDHPGRRKLLGWRLHRPRWLCRRRHAVPVRPLRLWPRLPLRTSGAKPERSRRLGPHLGLPAPEQFRRSRWAGRTPGPGPTGPAGRAARSRTANSRVPVAADRSVQRRTAGPRQPAPTPRRNRDDPGVGRPENGGYSFARTGTPFATRPTAASAVPIDSTQGYGALQVGVNAILRDDLNGTLRAGLFGTVGELWLQPYAVDGASGGRFSTYTLAGTLTWRWAPDGTSMRSCRAAQTTASSRPRLKAGRPNSASTAWSASIETGYPFALGWQGLALEPELQLIGQRLDFAPFTDADGNRRRPRLAEPGRDPGGCPASQAFRDNRQRRLHRLSEGEPSSGPGRRRDRQSRRLSVPDRNLWDRSAGSRRGRQRRPSQDLSAYGDVAWQNNVSTGGFRGWAFNGGVRYAF